MSQSDVRPWSQLEDELEEHEGAESTQSNSLQHDNVALFDSTQAACYPAAFSPPRSGTTTRDTLLPTRDALLRFLHIRPSGPPVPDVRFSQRRGSQ